MPKLLRLFLRGAIIGAVVAVVAVFGLLFFTDMRLAELVYRSEGGGIALAALTFLLSLTFGAAEIGMSVFLLDRNHDD